MGLGLAYTNRYGDERVNGYHMISDIRVNKLDNHTHIILSGYPTKTFRDTNPNSIEHRSNIEIQNEHYAQAMLEIANGSSIMVECYNYIKTTEKFKNAIDIL